MDELEARLNSAAIHCTSAAAKITELEAQVADLLAQDVKTRKQLWYLQKVAKGDFDGTKPLSAKNTATEVAEDEVIGADDLCF
jgi:hypothetical protein